MRSADFPAHKMSPPCKELNNWQGEFFSNQMPSMSLAHGLLALIGT